MTNTNSKQAKLRLEVRYNPKRTDPESLATALDRLLETALSTPGIMDDYGNPTFGPCWVATEDQPCEPQPPTSSPSLVNDLVAWAESLRLSPEDLDGEIHDQASAVVSDTNNRGLAAQIGFLLQHVGVDSTRGLLSELASGNTSKEP